jgi:hypothetical protein
MNAFDKICAVFAFAFGVVMVILGVVGLFAGSNAHFSLPPILGVLPALFGWGIVRAVYFGWQFKKPPDNVPAAPADPPTTQPPMA